MSDSPTTCPLCAEGHLHEQVAQNRVEYKEHSAELDLHYSVCDFCGSEQSDARQLRTNKRSMIAFKKRVDGLMPGSEVRALRKRLGISQVDAARIFGGGPVAFSKYEADDVAQSEAMDKLLRLVEQFPDVLDYLRRNAGMPDVQKPCWDSIPVFETHSKAHALKIVHSSSSEPVPEWEQCA